MLYYYLYFNDRSNSCSGSARWTRVLKPPGMEAALPRRHEPTGRACIKAWRQLLQARRKHSCRKQTGRHKYKFRMPGRRIAARQTGRARIRAWKRLLTARATRARACLGAARIKRCPIRFCKGNFTAKRLYFISSLAYYKGEGKRIKNKKK